MDLPQLMQSVVEPYLLDGPRRYSRREVAERSGVPADRAQQLWVSLGFPANPDDDAVEFTDADITALRTFTALEFSERGGERLQTAAARTLGQAMARLAEWQVELVTEEIRSRVEAAETDLPEADVVEIARQATRRTVAVLTDLQLYAWRRHLAEAMDRAVLNGSAVGATTRSLAVGFADMVGYTRLTRHLYQDGLAALLEAFETETTQAITAGGGRVIKNVGDEVMFAAETVADAAAIALAIHSALARAAETVDQMPQLRVGMAYGPVLQRFGDLYGEVVNTAARLTGVARPGTVLIDDQAAAELVDDPRFVIRHLRSVRVRGITRLRPHVLRHNGKGLD